MQDSIRVENHTMAADLASSWRSSSAADFADIFSVKDYDFALGDPLQAADPLPVLVEPSFDAANNQFVLVDPDGARADAGDPLRARRGRRRRRSAGRSTSSRARAGSVRVDVTPISTGTSRRPGAVERRFGEELAHVRDSLAAWQLRVPQLRAALGRRSQHSFGRSVADLASLRMRGNGGSAQLPAAGMPWFMTVFGRDTLITCLQTLLFGPELARSALEVLAKLQATEDDPGDRRRAGQDRPRGPARQGRRGAGSSAYYGTLDATPLYLVLLSEVWRWTDDAALVRTFREPALRALAWIDDYGDRDGDGFVEYRKRSPSGPRQPVLEGLRRLAALLRRPHRRAADRALRGAGLRLRREACGPPSSPARSGATAAWPSGSTREADELKARFDEAFWCEARRLLRARARRARSSGSTP